MKRNDYKNYLLSTVLCCAVVLAPLAALAHQPVEISRERQESAQSDTPVERDAEGRVRFKLARGGRVGVDNRSTGRMTVIGWDKDYVEAVATSERGQEFVRYTVGKDSSGVARIWLKADYADLEAKSAQSGTQTEKQPQLPEASPTPAPGAQPSAPSATGPNLLGEVMLPRFSLMLQDPPFSSDGQPVRITLEVHVPRYAELEPMRVWRSPVEVKGIETSVVIQGERSTLKLDQVGAVEIRNGSGLVEVSHSSGLVSVITASGPIRVSQATGDVRALSISGAIEIRCARGHVAVSNTEGPITLVGLSGDVVDANSTNSNIHFTGPLRDGGLYLLKSMAGSVEMWTSAGSGFTATLSSYRGGVETDYELKTNQAQHSPTANRIIGRFGTGRAQITLDSFDGAVKLKRAAPDEMTECK